MTAAEAMTTLGNITHVIFDLDGLILDTEVLYDQSIQRVLDRFDKNYTYDVKRKLMGMKYSKAMELLRVELDVPMTADQLVSETLSLLHDSFKTCGTKPGAERLILHLAAHGIPMCIATGSSSEDYQLKIHSHQQMISLMEFAVRSDDPQVKFGKPNPDIFLVAMNRFSAPPTSPESCLVLEDAPNGVTAALAAGMKTVMVPDPRLTDVLPAHRIIKSLVDFIPEEFGLPPF